MFPNQQNNQGGMQQQGGFGQQGGGFQQQGGFGGGNGMGGGNAGGFQQQGGFGGQQQGFQQGGMQQQGAPQNGGGNGGNRSNVLQGFDLNVNLAGAEAWGQGGTSKPLPSGPYKGLLDSWEFTSTQAGDKANLAVKVKVAEGGPNDGSTRTLYLNAIAYTDGRPPEDYMRNKLLGLLDAIYGAQAAGYSGSVVQALQNAKNTNMPIHFKHVSKEDSTQTDNNGNPREVNLPMTADAYNEAKAAGAAMAGMQQGGNAGGAGFGNAGFGNAGGGFQQQGGFGGGNGMGGGFNPGQPQGQGGFNPQGQQQGGAPVNPASFVQGFQQQG